MPYISSLDSSTTDSYLAASEASRYTVPLPATPNLTTRKSPKARSSPSSSHSTQRKLADLTSRLRAARGSYLVLLCCVTTSSRSSLHDINTIPIVDCGGHRHRASGIVLSAGLQIIIATSLITDMTPMSRTMTMRRRRRGFDTSSCAPSALVPMPFVVSRGS